ncbi:MAG: RlmE family RNA methyltransferase [Candidatus Baldrarchaeia archaeon]
MKRRRRKPDYYYLKAKREGYRSRAIYKLEQIDRKYRVFDGVKRVLDLCCAPGGWLQYSLKRVGKDGVVVGVDIVDISPLPGVVFIKGDITDDSTLRKIMDACPEKYDLILSDCSPNVSGVWCVDHARQVFLAQRSLEIARSVLRVGGNFVVKVFQGDMFEDFLKNVKELFSFVKPYKPEASRKRSAEIYIIAKRFRNP